MGEDIQVFQSEYLRFRSEPKGLILHEAKVIAQGHKHPYALCLVFMPSLGGYMLLGGFPYCNDILEFMSSNLLSTRRQTGSHSLVKSSVSRLSYSWSYHGRSSHSRLSHGLCLEEWSTLASGCQHPNCVHALWIAFN